MEIDAVKKIHPFKESIDLVTKGTKKHPYQPAAGEYFVPKVKSRRSNGHLQTFSEWAGKPSEEIVDQPEPGWEKEKSFKAG